MVELDPATEQQLAELSADEWHAWKDALEARVRPPTSAQKLKEIASQVISGDRLSGFLKAANPKAFTDEAGNIDEAQVLQSLRTLFDLPPAGANPRHQQFLQYAPPPPSPGPGDRGKAEAGRRFKGERPPTGSASMNEQVAKRFGRQK